MGSKKPKLPFATAPVVTPAMKQALNNAKRIASGKATLEMSYGAIGMVCMLAFAYMVITSIGIDTYRKCDNKPKKSAYEFLTHTLAIALAIPFTLFLGRMFKSDLGLWMTFFGLMGLIGASITVHINNKCKNAKKSNRQFSYFALPMFIMSLLVGGFMITKKPKVMPVPTTSTF
jgi:hypothetical protein